MYFKKALEIKQKIADKNGISSCYLSIGNIALRKENFPKAISYYKKALELKKVLNDKKGPSNVDARGDLERLVSLIGSIAEKAPVVFPVHPRTRNMLEVCGLIGTLPAQCFITQPLPYGEFIALCEHAVCVVTDSGGIQEETTYLGVPCITLRKNTERPVTVTEGTNTLMGDRFEDVAGAVDEILRGNVKHGTIPSLWDGHASERVADILLSKLAGQTA